MPPFWGEMADLGWLSLHIPEEFGGSGYGIAKLSVVIEAARCVCRPGPFIPTVAASAIINAAADDATKATLLTSLTDGSVVAGIALGEGFVTEPADADNQVQVDRCHHRRIRWTGKHRGRSIRRRRPDRRYGSIRSDR